LAVPVAGDLKTENVAVILSGTYYILNCELRNGSKEFCGRYFHTTVPLAR
jgi:hypothetical protein